MELLAQLRKVVDRLAVHNALVLGVGPSADYQAQALLDQGMPFPLLLDPDNTVRACIGADERFSLHQLLRPSAVLTYARAFRQARDSDPIWSQTTERPAVIVVDGELDITWTYIGRHLGDYPSVTAILEAVARTAASK